MTRLLPLLALLIAMGCAPKEQPVTLTFAAQIGEEPMACGTTYAGIGTSGVDAQVTDFRFYTSNFRLIAEDGAEVPLTLDQDGMWQYESVALLDFEDATADCQSGTPEMNATVTGTAPAGTYTGVAFDIGVPHELNHLDNAMAPSPLNISSLFWTWRAGYMFNRVDMRYQNGDEQGAWLLHIGSTGCESAASTMPPATMCSRPNRVPIRLTGFDPTAQPIIADATGLLHGIDLTTAVPAPPGCMAGPNDPDCAKMFPNVGLSLESGACEGDCQEQRYFRVGNASETLAAQ